MPAPQCHGGALHPSTSTPDATLCAHPVRYHPIQSRLPAAGHRRLFAMSAAARAQRADVPNHAREWHHPDRHDLGSWAIAPHRPTRGSWRNGRHTTSRHRQDSPVLPQQLRRDPRGSARPLRCVLQARGSAESAARTCRRFCRRTVSSSIADSSPPTSGRRCWRTFESCRAPPHRLQPDLSGVPSHARKRRAE